MKPEARMVKSLTEEFDGLGLNGSEMIALSGVSGGDVPAVLSAAAPGHYDEPLDESDPIDGKYVSHELIDRIAALPIEDLDEESIDNLLAALSEKEIDESDEHLLNKTTETVRRLTEASKFLKVMMKGGRAVKTWAHKLVGRAKALAKRWRHSGAGHRAEIKAERKQIKKARSGKWQRAREKVAAASARVHGVGKKIRSFFKRAFGGKSESIGFDSENMELVHELMGLAESDGYGSNIRHSIEGRIARIFSMLSEEFGDEAIDDIMEDVFDRAALLTESDLTDEEYHEAIKPALKVMKRLIEQLESSGN